MSSNIYPEIEVKIDIKKLITWIESHPLNQYEYKNFDNYIKNFYEKVKIPLPKNPVVNLVKSIYPSIKRSNLSHTDKFIVLLWVLELNRYPFSGKSPVSYSSAIETMGKFCKIFNLKSLTNLGYKKLQELLKTNIVQLESFDHLGPIVCANLISGLGMLADRGCLIDIEYQEILSQLIPKMIEEDEGKGQINSIGAFMVLKGIKDLYEPCSIDISFLSEEIFKTLYEKLDDFGKQKFNSLEYFYKNYLDSYNSQIAQEEEAGQKIIENEKENKEETKYAERMTELFNQHFSLFNTKSSNYSEEFKKRYPNGPNNF